jgi:mannosyltransferase
VPTPLRPGRRRALAALAVATSLGLGVVVRFLTTSPLWLDEALTVRIAGMPLGQIGSALRRDGHPPLYYWLLHGWIDVFGSGNVAVRSLSGVFSLACLPLMWKVGDRVGGPRVARWSLLLLALSPFAVRYATEARMYSLVMFLVLCLALLLDTVLDRPRPLPVVGLALVTGALLWTHYWSLYLLAVVGGLVVVRWWRDRAERPAARWAVVGLAAGGLLWLPWIPSVLEQAAHTGTPWALPSRPTVVAQTTIADFGGGGFAEALLLGTLLVVLAVAAFAHSDRVPSASRPLRPMDVRILANVCGATLLVGSGAAYVTSGAYAPRYAAVIAPFFLVVAAVGITRLRPTWMQAALVGSAALLAVAALGHNVRDQRTRADDIAHVITSDGTDADLVVVCPDQLGPSLSRVLDQERSPVTVVPYPGAGDAHLVDWRDYAERNAKADPAAFARGVLTRADGAPIWVVWSGTYRTLKGQCEQVVAGIAKVRGEQPGVPFTGAFESATLVRFP